MNVEEYLVKAQQQITNKRRKQVIARKIVVDNFGRSVCNVCGKSHSYSHHVINWKLFFDRIESAPVDTQLRWCIGESGAEFVQVKATEVIPLPQETVDFYEKDAARREEFKKADPARNKLLRENWRWLNEDVLGVVRTDLPIYHPARKDKNYTY